MVKIAIRHYIIEYALNHLFDKYINEFAESKYITYKDLNKTHLYRYIEMYDGDYGLKLIGDQFRNKIIKSMQIVQFADVAHVFYGACDSNPNVYYILVYMLDKNGIVSYTKYPLLPSSSIILK